MRTHARAPRSTHNRNIGNFPVLFCWTPSAGKMEPPARRHSAAPKQDRGYNPDRQRPGEVAGEQRNHDAQERSACLRTCHCHCAFHALQSRLKRALHHALLLRIQTRKNSAGNPGDDTRNTAFISRRKADLIPQCRDSECWQDHRLDSSTPEQTPGVKNHAAPRPRGSR